jgi:hypothetical protein
MRSLLTLLAGGCFLLDDVRVTVGFRRALGRFWRARLAAVFASLIGRTFKIIVF